MFARPSFLSAAPSDLTARFDSDTPHSLANLASNDAAVFANFTVERFASFIICHEFLNDFSSDFRNRRDAIVTGNETLPQTSFTGQPSTSLVRRTFCGQSFDCWIFIRQIATRFFSDDFLKPSFPFVEESGRVWARDGWFSVVS